MAQALTADPHNPIEMALYGDGFWLYPRWYWARSVAAQIISMRPKTASASGGSITVEAADHLPASATQDAGAKPSAATGAKRRDTATLILGALCAHHGYDGTSIGKWEPVGVRQLSTLTATRECKPVAPATVTRWFEKNFTGGHSDYERQCASEVLLNSLKKLNNDFTPYETDIAIAESKARRADRIRDNAFAGGDS